MKRVLVVDDDRDLVDLLGFALRRAGLEPVPAHDASEALRALDDHHPDVVVLDINLGGTNGFDLLQELRRRTALPVIVLTAHDSEDDKVRGLELGADDYLTKPFSHRELIARIRAQLRRADYLWVPPEGSAGVLRVGPLVLDAVQHRVEQNGRPVRLSVIEFRLLQLLMMNAGVVVPADAILRHVWGYNYEGDTDVVRVAVHRLRRKLGDDPARPCLLHTIPGVGILLKADEAPGPGGEPQPEAGAAPAALSP